MDSLKSRARLLARRAAKGAAAVALHKSGARELLATLQRRAAGGRRVLILSYHRVVGNFAQEKDRGLHTLNIAQDTFRKHLLTLLETHDVVSLDTALDVLDGRLETKRDVAVITFDDGYRGVYDWGFPVLRELKLPAIVYVPSSFIGSTMRLAHDRLWIALKRMEDRRVQPLAVGAGRYEAWLVEAFRGHFDAHKALERLIAVHPTPALHGLADVLEERLGLAGRRPSELDQPMTWEQLREMDAHRFETGAHTAEHCVLTNVALSEARREIAQCKAVIDANLGKPVKHFAYCNGYYSAGVAQALRAEGFASAVTTEDMPNLPGVDPYALKRKVLWESSSAGALGGFSAALAACQFDDTFQMLSLQKPVPGARPTRFDQGDGERAGDPPSSLAKAQ